MRLPEAPHALQPPRHEIIQRPLQLATGLVVNHPPRRQHVGPRRAVVLRRIEVDAPKQPVLLLG